MSTKVAITIEFDSDSIEHYTDSFLATLWHVVQANPAPYADREASEAAERVGREIIRRWLKNAPTELWKHQGSAPYHAELMRHGKWPGGGPKWIPHLAAPAERLCDLTEALLRAGDEAVPPSLRGVSEPDVAEAVQKLRAVLATGAQR